MICFKPLYISWQRSHSSRLLFVIFTLLLIKSFLSLPLFSCSCHCRFISLYKGPCHTHKVQRLNESTSYTFRIQAFNEAGEGPFSNVYTFTTPRSPPAPVKGTVAFYFCISLFLSIFSDRCGSALIITLGWHTDSQCARLSTSVNPSLTCIWLRPSSPRFTCRLSSWVGLFSTVIYSVLNQPLKSLFWSYMLKSVMRTWVLFSVRHLFWIRQSCASFLSITQHSLSPHTVKWTLNH